MGVASASCSIRNALVATAYRPTIGQRTINNVSASMPTIASNRLKPIFVPPRMNRGVKPRSVIKSTTKSNVSCRLRVFSRSEILCSASDRNSDGLLIYTTCDIQVENDGENANAQYHPCPAIVRAGKHSHR